MAVTSKASAVWNGGLKGGNGTFDAGSGAFKGPYTFATRFEGTAGTNPEELLAAAHSACYSMALSGALEKAGTPATTIATVAHCTVDTIDGKPTVAVMKLVVKGTVPGLTAAQFTEAAEGAKVGCPVSRALAGIPTVTVDATLA
ncbi:MAG: OsmC family peroxiredoxin [Gemmatimonadales bacterium]